MGTSIVSIGMSIVWTAGQVSRYSRHKAACRSATQLASYGIQGGDKAGSYAGSTKSLVSRG